MIDLSGLSETHREAVREALARCSFDFDLLDRDISAESVEGLDHTVDGNEDIRGLAWDDGRLQVDADLSQSQAVLTFMLEMAHMVDYFLLTPTQRREIRDAYGAKDWFEENGETDYRRWAGEAFMEGFVRAFTDLDVEPFGFAYDSTPEVVRTIRRVLGQASLNRAIRLR